MGKNAKGLWLRVFYFFSDCLLFFYKSAFVKPCPEQPVYAHLWSISFESYDGCPIRYGKETYISKGILSTVAIELDK